MIILSGERSRIVPLFVTMHIRDFMGCDSQILFLLAKVTTMATSSVVCGRTITAGPAKQARLLTIILR